MHGNACAYLRFFIVAAGVLCLIGQYRTPFQVRVLLGILRFALDDNLNRMS